MEDTVFTVTSLNEYIKLLIEGDPRLARVCVRGEISNFTNHYKSGHFYFTLKDETAAVHAVMFRSDASRVPFTPENGMKILATGRIGAYVRDGQYQLYCESMEPDGIGALYLAFEKLKEKLSSEGLFDAAHKKPLPKCPLRVGVITSSTGAAVRDIINISARRFPLAELILYPALVQGEGAAPQLCAAVHFFNEKYPVDVILIGRGGGSIEDLWAFNDEKLAREIFASAIPVVSAVGHETDFTICDFVSDVRAPTPSAAAELALPDTAEMKRRFMHVQELLEQNLLRRIELLKTKLGAFSEKPCLKRPEGFLEERRVALDRADEALMRASDLYLERKKAAFAATAARLDALSPLGAFSRGYCALFNGQGTAVKSVDTLKEQEDISMRLADGSVRARITEIRREQKHG